MTCKEINGKRQHDWFTLKDGTHYCKNCGIAIANGLFATLQLAYPHLSWVDLLDYITNRIGVTHVQIATNFEEEFKCGTSSIIPSAKS